VFKLGSETGNGTVQNEAFGKMHCGCLPNWSRSQSMSSERLGKLKGHGRHWVKWC